MILSFCIVLLSLNSIYGGRLNVRDFGALGDGSRDDTESIKAAIKSLKNGDTLYFPENKKYKISSPFLFYKSDVVLEFGKDSWLVADSDGKITDYNHSHHNCVFYSVGQKNITFLNLQIDGQNIPSVGIYIWGGSNINFINSTFSNLMGNDTLWSAGLDLRRCHDVIIDSCKFIEISNTNKSATGVILNSNPKATNRKDICTNIYIKNSIFKNIISADDADGIKFVGRLENKNLYSNSIVENCTLINCYKRAVKIQTNGIKVLNNVIENNRITNEIGSPLISIQGVDSVDIIGNQITFNGKNLAAIGFILRNKNILIQDNDIIFDGDIIKNVNNNYGIQSLCWRSKNPEREPPFWGENIKIKNINISTINNGKLDYGIYLYTTTGGGKYWEIDSVVSPDSPFGILEGFEKVIITNSIFSEIRDKTRTWSFNESSGDKLYTAFYNLNKNNIDRTIYSGFTGTLHNISWVDGKNEKGLYFNGTDTYVDFHTGNLWLMEDKTLMMWMKINEGIDIGSGSLRYYPGIFSTSNRTDSNNFITFDKDPIQGTYHILYSDEKGNIRRSDAFEYNSGDWLHLAIVMENDSIPTFYINGEPKGTKNKSARLKLNYLGIGYGGAMNRGGFQGIMEDLRILNKALDADSISSYYRKH
jgi:hypothetical protein